MSLFNENAEVLRELEARGVDLSQMSMVDFSHLFPDAASASSFIEACKSAGYDAVDTTEEGAEHSDVTVSKEMIPTCENITVNETALGKMAERFSGHSDGWGFFGS